MKQDSCQYHCFDLQGVTFSQTLGPFIDAPAGVTMYFRGYIFPRGYHVLKHVRVIALSRETWRNFIEFSAVFWYFVKENYSENSSQYQDKVANCNPVNSNI